MTDRNPPPPSDVVRARAIAQCTLQLDRLGRLAREFDADEIFDVACEFLANTVPLVRARLEIGGEASPQVLTWQTSESVRARDPRSILEVARARRSGIDASLSLELVDFSYGRAQELAEEFMQRLSHALSRSRSLAEKPPRSLSGLRAALSVIVVEDDDDAWRALVDVIESDGYRVRRARNGVDALASMRVELPAVVLFDVRGRDGDGDFHRLQREDPSLRDVPLVAVAKPIEPAQLSRAIAAAILEAERRGGRR